MPHIGIERLGAGYAKKDPAQNEKARVTVGQKIVKSEKGIEGGEDRRMPEDPKDTQHRYGQEPKRHDRAEGFSDARRAKRLDGEKRPENC